MQLQQIRQRLEGRQELLRRSLGVIGLLVFGSVARGEATEHSDVDMLVEFDGPADLDRYVRLKTELEALLGLPIDLVTRKALRPALRSVIEREAVRVA